VEHYEHINKTITKRFDLVNYDSTININDQDTLPFISLHNLNVKRDIFIQHGITVSEKVFYDDMEYVLYPFIYARTIKYLDLNVYVYRLGNEGQSVSLKGRQRHIKSHQFIIMNLVSTFNNFKKSEYFTLKKELYISSRIGGMISGQFENYMSFPLSNREKYIEFQDFNKYSAGLDETIVKQAKMFLIVKYSMNKNMSNPMWIVIYKLSWNIWKLLILRKK